MALEINEFKQVHTIEDDAPRKAIYQLIFDDYYHQGLELGRHQKEYEKNYAFAKSLLLNTDFDVSKIAELVGVTTEFVAKVKLTHESYTIQIPHLKLNQQNTLEQVLEVFSQEYVTDDLHKLDYKTSENPLVQKMLRRLAKAASDAEILRLMNAEDSFDRIMNREMQEKNDKIEELVNTIEEQDKKIAEQHNAIEEMKRAFEDMKKQLGL